MEFLPGFFGMLMVFVIYIAVGIDGLAYDATCTADGDCTDTNANKCIDDGGTLKCKCNTDSFRRTSPAECVIKIVAGSTCIAGDTCADTNAACDTSALQCLCTAASHFQKNDNTCAAKVAALDGACVTAETATDQCAIANSECRTDQCLCKDTHFKSGTTCTTKIVTGSTCAAGDTCADANAACHATDLQCLCASSHFQKNDNTCATKVAALEQACVTAETATDQCNVADSECRSDQCLCKDTHYKTGATCTARKNPDIACDATGQCITNAECDVSGTGKCECNAGYTETPTDTPTMCSGVVKFASLSYMYVVPILISMMSLL